MGVWSVSVWTPGHVEARITGCPEGNRRWAKEVPIAIQEGNHRRPLDADLHPLRPRPKGHLCLLSRQKGYSSVKKRLLGLAALMALLVGGAWALTGSSSANAAPGNGATVINDTQCFPAFPVGYTFCITQKAQFNSTTTPSGNVNIEANGKSSFTYSNPSNAVVSSGDDALDERLVLRGELAWHRGFSSLLA